MLKRASNSTAAVPVSGSKLWIFTVATILLAHFAVDVYALVVPSLLGVVESEFRLSPELAAVLLGWGTFFSGISQPLFAWVSDRWNTRLCAAGGLVLACVGVSLIGTLSGVSVLFSVYGIAAIGMGMFHPIAAATIGRLAGVNRGRAISWFFVAGMAGGFCGSSLAPAISTGSGTLLSLRWLIIPGLIMAAILHLTVRSIPHKRIAPKLGDVSVSSHELNSYSWVSIGILYVVAVLRFMVNIALMFLIVRWVQQPIALLHPDWSQEQVAQNAAPLVGRLNGAMIFGMGIGGIVAGMIIKAGQEKGPMVWVPMLFSMSIMLIGFLNYGWLAYAAFVGAGIGFGAMTPVSISVAQRLMPGHSSLASGLMLGGAWAFAFVGPTVAHALLTFTNMSTTFVVVGAALLVSGLLCKFLDAERIECSVATDLLGE